MILFVFQSVRVNKSPHQEDCYSRGCMRHSLSAPQLSRARFAIPVKLLNITIYITFYTTVLCHSTHV